MAVFTGGSKEEMQMHNRPCAHRCGASNILINIYIIQTQFLGVFHFTRGVDVEEKVISWNKTPMGTFERPSRLLVLDAHR